MPAMTLAAARGTMNPSPEWLTIFKIHSKNYISFFSVQSMFANMTRGF
jgi:hypothetical protein